MASVKLQWHPYGGYWIASASWSSGYEVASEGRMDLLIAIGYLITILEGELLDGYD